MENTDKPKCTHCGNHSVESDAVCSLCLWDNIAGERAAISNANSPTVRKFLKKYQEGNTLTRTQAIIEDAR